MKKALLIVDPQYDFINGSLPVPEAQAAMDTLAEYVTNSGGQYAVQIVTLDWHPFDHSSFTAQGGQWPAHCVAYTFGAAIWQPLAEALNSGKTPIHILTKGDCRTREDYSILNNPGSAETFARLIEEYGIEHIDICGLAGDICVATTGADIEAQYGKEFITYLREYSPCIGE